MEEFFVRKEAYWERKRREKALRLFHKAADKVKAYKDFLKKQGINPKRIQAFTDLSKVPPVNKNNYLRQYSLQDLMWPGALKPPLVFTATSGSTGDPFYFPRSESLDRQYSLLAEQFLRNSSHGAGPTLVVVGFGMGVWIGGLITYKAFEMAAIRGKYAISIITPGINKPEIFNALRDLAPKFSQTILIGYPPFIKDVLDEAASEGIRLSNLNLRFLFAAESFTEKFRDYIAKKAGVRDVCADTLNVYGSADIGAMAWETPTAVAVRRAASKNKKIFTGLFGDLRKTPTLAEYD